MTVPQQYTLAQRLFDAFLADALRELDQETTHQAFHTVMGVLRAFRSRLPTQDALRFADALPALLCAAFVTDWDLSQPQEPFGGPADWLADTRHYQRHHNFAPDHAVAAVARALRRHVDLREFERVLAALPPAASDFWGVSSAVP